MKERIQQYRIISNWQLADQVFEIELEGDSSWITHPGQFLNVTIDNAYLKRPISICDWNENGLTLIYKVVGFGTKQMSQKPPGTMLECLVGLGNGFTPEAFEEKRVLLVGGGVGAALRTGKNLSEARQAAGGDPGLYLGKRYFLHQEIYRSGLRCHAQHQRRQSGREGLCQRRYGSGRFDRFAVFCLRTDADAQSGMENFRRAGAAVL